MVVWKSLADMVGGSKTALGSLISDLRLRDGMKLSAFGELTDGDKISRRCVDAEAVARAVDKFISGQLDVARRRGDRVALCEFGVGCDTESRDVSDTAAGRASETASDIDVISIDQRGRIMKCSDGSCGEETPVAD